jgi:phosphohistidine phosphatase SixA
MKWSAPAFTLHRAAALLFAAALLVPFAARADEAAWKLLEAGGQIVMLRHAVTDPGVGDPEGMRLEDCATQRNLSAQGRAHAARIGAALRARGVAVGRVLSSPWCRCLDTARLAFGAQPQVTPALGNLFGRRDAEARQLAQMKLLAAAKPARGNTVMVSHGSTIQALTGVSPGTGEMVVLTPLDGGGFRVAGRIAVD